MSQLDIYNLTLDALGTRSTVSALNEGSAEANALNRHYDAARLEVLAAYEWSFARQQATLALLNDATQGQPVPTPWLYEYAVPSNNVRMRYILPMFNSMPGTNVGGASVPMFSGPAVKFVMSSDTDSNGNDINVLLTNQNQAIAIYTKSVTNVALFTSQFTEALRLYLGHRICIALTGDKQLSKGLFDEAQDAIRKAAATNQDEGLTVNESIPDWLRVRGYASDWAYPGGSSIYYGPNSLTMVS